MISILSIFFSGSQLLWFGWITEEKPADTKFRSQKGNRGYSKQLIPNPRITRAACTCVIARKYLKINLDLYADQLINKQIL